MYSHQESLEKDKSPRTKIGLDLSFKLPFSLSYSMILAKPGGSPTILKDEAGLCQSPGTAFSVAHQGLAFIKSTSIQFSVENVLRECVTILIEVQAGAINSSFFIC